METGAPVTDGAAEMGSPTILSDGLLRPPTHSAPLDSVPFLQRGPLLLSHDSRKPSTLPPYRYTDQEVGSRSGGEHPLL